MSGLSVASVATNSLRGAVQSSNSEINISQCRSSCEKRFPMTSSEEWHLGMGCLNQCWEHPQVARALSTSTLITATSLDATPTEWLGSGKDRRDPSYASSSAAGYAVTGPSTITITETWIHHDTVCSATPAYATSSVKSDPVSYALSTSKSIPASYAVKTSSHISTRPAYPTAPVYKPSSSGSTPENAASWSKSTQATYAASTSKSTPAYYISSAESTTSKPHPVYPTGHYSQTTTSSRYIPSPPQSSSMGDYTPLASGADGVPIQPAMNTTYNKPTAASSVPVISETIVSLGGASAYGISLGAAALAVAAML